MTSEILKKRTFDFALNVMKQIDKLKMNTTNQIMGKQVLRSATSVGANYRSACKAKSTPDFVNKLKIVEEESDETVYWLELIKSNNNIKDAEFESVLEESRELMRIFAASAITAKRNAIVNK